MKAGDNNPAAAPLGIRGVGRLGLAALGIVFGDIGTSPLYTLRACLSARDAAPFSSADILGILSLIFWTLTLASQSPARWCSRRSSSTRSRAPRGWRWPFWKAASLLALFLSVDLTFFVADLFKVVDGGFLPLAVGLVLFVGMATWKRGRRIFRDQVEADSPPFADVLSICRRSPVVRTPGVGVFVTGHPDGVPPVLRALVERVGVLPETVVLLTMKTCHVPRIGPGDGGRYDRLADGFHRLVIERGYLDQPDVPAALARACLTWSIPIDPKQATFYLGFATFIASSAGRMGHWSESLFAFMARNSRPVTDAFCIPPARVVEIDSRIDL